MALLLARKIGEVVEIQTSDGTFKVWVDYAKTGRERFMVFIDAPQSVLIKRDDMKKEKA